MLKDNVNKFLKVCLDSAKAAEVSYVFLNELGLGKFAYAKYMRDGTKAVIDMQNELMNLNFKNELLNDELETYKKIASSDELELLSDDDLKKIKDFIDTFKE